MLKSEKMDRSPKRNTRQLRDRKERKFYTDDILGDADDEIEGPQSFDLEEKLETDRFNKPVVKELKGSEFNLAYIQQHGFITPLIFKDKTGLGIRIPGPNFCVGDVKTCVGSKRMLDVMDVKTQKNLELTMKEWQEYYDNPKKDRLLNVISLEFSHTMLENLVESPTVVRQLDWVDRVWPHHLKNMQTESTNVMDEMMYPKVQKYCLMSVNGCFTDFHVDFGGTSVWYHILKGAKVFWLIPPTEKNLELYQSWVLSGKQGDTFFGDNVEECGRVYLQSGDTFFIPSGWIHAVYTPKDSLVFGGNFLHSFGIDKQLRIAMVEEATKVPQKFRYPFFTEMLWYTLERYVHCLLGKSFIKIPNDDDAENNGQLYKEVKKLVPDGVHVSPQELVGLKSIVMYLHQLPIQRKNVPTLIYDPVELLKAVRQVVEEHRYDNPDKAVTGIPILVWPDEKPEDVGKILPKYSAAARKSAMMKAIGAASNVIPVDNCKNMANTNNNSNYTNAKLNLGGDILRKRIRCGVCQSCTTAEDCKQCVICTTNINSSKTLKDASNSVNRQTVCIMRQCMKPLLPITSACAECGMDGWNEMPPASNAVIYSSKATPSTLMECSLCCQITHPICIAHKASTKVIAIVNDDLPNSWECPICLEKDLPQRLLKKERNSSLEGNRRVSTESNNNNNVSQNSNALLVPSTAVIEENSNVPPSLQPQVLVSSVRNGNNKSFFGDGKIDPMRGLNKEDEFREIGEMVVRSSVSEAESKKALLKGPARLKSIEDIKPCITSLAEASPNVLKRTMSSDTSKGIPSRRASTDSGVGLTTSSSNASSTKAKPSSVKSEPVEKVVVPLKKLKKKSDAEDDSDDEAPKRSSPIKYPFRTELAGKILNSSTKVLKKPTNVVRPAQLSDDYGDETNKPLWRRKCTMLPVMKLLDLPTLSRVMSVCKDWNAIAMSSELWETLNLTHRTITAEVLRGSVRRQPIHVVLDWAFISKQQLFWLISRLPQLRTLSLRGLHSTWVAALKTCFCPMLCGLDLGYVDGLTDAALRELLAPPVDTRPGLTDSKSRLRHLRSLCLAGAALSDVALRYVTQHAGSISELDLSTCSRITDAGIAQLGQLGPDSPGLGNLTTLNISGCPQLTNISLDHLKRCKKLKVLDIRNIPQMTLPGVTKFINDVRAVNNHVIVKSAFGSVSGLRVTSSPSAGSSVSAALSASLLVAGAVGNPISLGLLT